MSAYELALKYYPHLWPLERLDALLEVGMLTREEYNVITGVNAEERKDA